VDETSPLLTELRDRQGRLAAALDQIDHLADDSEDYDRAFAAVGELMRQVVASRDAIPRHEHQVLHDRYTPWIRGLGIGLAVLAVAAVAGVAIGRIDPWLTLMVLPLLVLGGWLALRAAGDRNRFDGATPRDRLLAGLVGLAAMGLVLASGLVSGWFLIGAIPTGLVAIAVATLTGPAAGLTSGEVLDA